MAQKISFLEKTLTCSVSGLVVCCACRPNLKFVPGWAVPVVLGFGLLVLVCTFFGIFIWHFREKKEKICSARVFAFSQGMISFSTAYFMMSFGLQKILRLQIASTLFWLDTPPGLLNADQIVSLLFGQSYPLSAFIGFLQILGAICLLFRKTRMLGVFILLPILLNIVLIDAVFGMDWLISTIAAILTVGLFFILNQEKETVLAFLFGSISNLKNDKKNI